MKNKYTCFYLKRNLVNLCVLVALSTLGVPNLGYTQNAATGYSAELPHNTKTNLLAQKGSCLPKSNLSVLNKFNIKTYEADNYGPVNSAKSLNRKEFSGSDSRRASLANVLGAMSRASNGKLDRLIQNTDFFYGRGGDVSRQVRYGIQLNPNRGNGQAGVSNAALIAHEFGHKVGGAGGQYTAYKNFMGGAKCVVSQRGNHGHNHIHSPNEVFADMFSAYVTNPGLFHNRGSGCAKAFNFFKGLFGESNLKKRCDSRKGSFSGSVGRGSVGTKGGGGGFASLIQAIKNRKKKRKKDSDKYYNATYGRPTKAQDEAGIGAGDTIQ